MNELWRNLGQVFQFEFRRQGQRRGYLFMTFGVPLIAIVLFFGYQYIQQNNAPADGQENTSEAPDFGVVGYVDHSGLFLDPGLFSAALVRYDDEAAASAALEAGDIST
ncbi:MAG: hypothetical protein JW910_10415, partial [Anaerolineae bacterium]|nr:hypothetical protein [Anaerolineae bacterium]